MKPTSTARAKTILVFGDRDTAVALTSDLRVATTHKRGRQRLSFSGVVTFHPETKQHIRVVLLPLIDRICQCLGIKRRHFEISAANIGAASNLERSIQISGWSADAPLFCALLATCCQLEVPPDSISTGHIASREGEIRLVSQLAQKLHAAVINRSLNRFIHPDLVADDSLKNLAPNDLAELAAVTKGAHDRLSLVSVRNVAELIKAVFDERELVCGSLKAGYFGRHFAEPAGSPEFDQAVLLLAGNVTERFYRCLENVLLRGDAVGAKALLTAFVEFHLRRRRYPSGFGSQLKQILASVPPVTLRLKLQFPLLSENHLLRLINLAQDSDRDDSRLLAETVSGHFVAGEQTSPLPRSGRMPAPETQEPLDCSAVVSLEYLLQELNETTLVRKIDRTIDEARASFVLNSVVMPNNQEFLATVSSFYLHVFRNLGVPKTSMDQRGSQAQALDWVIRTYAQKGGYAQALAEACSGTQGGMRHVLDLMTEQLKREKRRDHIFYHLQKAIDHTNWEERVNFMRAVIARFPDAVPLELRHATPEQFVKHEDEIMTTLVESLVAFNRIAKTR